MPNKRKYNPEYWAEYRRKNSDKIHASHAKWRAENKDTIHSIQKAYRERNKAKPAYKLRKNLRERLRGALRGLSKSDSTMTLLGCTVEELRAHLEKQFTSGMTWDNYGEWHVDHIKPVTKFNLVDPAEQLLCFHFSNLQPLWAKDNIRKGNRLTTLETLLK